MTSKAIGIANRGLATMEMWTRRGNTGERTSLRYGIVLMFAMILGIGCLGCKPSTNAKPAVVVDEANRPPLRVMVVGESGIAPILTQRWKGASQQGLEVQELSLTDWLALDKCATDVLLFPSSQLGEAVERKWISAMPLSLEKKFLDESQATVSDGSEAQWPAHWRQLVTYAKQAWGVPLGDNLIWIVRSDAEGSMGPWSVPQLKALTTAAAPKENTVPAANKVTLLHDVAMVTAEEAMVDRFLMVLFSQEPGQANLQTGLFFQLSNMQPRFEEPVFRQAIADFLALAALDPQGFSATHEASWQRMVEQQAAFAIASPGNWKRQDGDPSMMNLAVGALRCQDAANQESVIVDGGNAWIAAVAQATRQSSASAYFLEWLDQDDQRESLHRETRRVAPRKSGMSNLAASNPDMASYYRQSAAAASRQDVLKELRIRGGRDYRLVLGKALREMVAKPDQVDAILRDCSQEWEKITEKLGRDTQRVSLERSLQLSNMSGR